MKRIFILLLMMGIVSISGCVSENKEQSIEDMTGEEVGKCVLLPQSSERCCQVFCMHLNSKVIKEYKHEEICTCEYKPLHSKELCEEYCKTKGKLLFDFKEHAYCDCRRPQDVSRDKCEEYCKKQNLSGRFSINYCTCYNPCLYDWKGCDECCYERESDDGKITGFKEERKCTCKKYPDLLKSGKNCEKWCEEHGMEKSSDSFFWWYTMTPSYDKNRCVCINTKTNEKIVCRGSGQNISTECPEIETEEII